MSTGKRIGIGLGVFVVVGAAVAMIAASLPRALDVGNAGIHLTGDDIAGRELALGQYRANYSRWSAVLGITVSRSTGVQTVRQTEPGILDVTFELGDFGTDMMRLRQRDLVIHERWFGDPDGPGQRFTRSGNAIDVVVTAADGSARDLRFEYPLPVFEPSLLEYPLGLLNQEVGVAGRLAWSNFSDPEEYWLSYRVLGRESIQAAGSTFDTKRVRVEFPDGKQRDYWLTDRPPYKVRMISYDRGRLVTSGWTLEELEIGD